MGIKINCKCIDNLSNGFLCFVKSTYPEEDLDNIKADGFGYLGIILLEELEPETVKALIQQLDLPVSKIDLCLCGCASDSYMNQLLGLKELEGLRSIRISVKDVYGISKGSGIQIGLEDWSNCFAAEDQLTPVDSSRVQLADILRLEPYVMDIINWMLGYAPQNDLEKIVLLDCWLQKNIQYIKERESSAAEGIYICENMIGESHAEDVLLRHFGRCEDIAFTAALVLNHPNIGVACRQVTSSIINHSWNIIFCEGKEYYCDFTHNITRNPCRIPEALKAKKYTDTYTLLGKNDAIEEYGISDCYDCSNVADDSYCRDEIVRVVKRLFGEYPPIFPDEVVMRSYLKAR